MLRMSGKGFPSAVLFVCLGFLLGARGNAEAQSIFLQAGDLEAGPFVMPVRAVLANTVMAAYQKPYAMNFEVWRPQGIPAGWYATFDGYPVAQMAPNRWVYGRMGVDGCLVPTDVLVGSVVPMRVPHLARVTASWIGNDFIRSAAFRKILEFKCDNMGILEDPLAATVLAWCSGKPGVWVWLGDHWKKVSPASGQYTWEALRRRRCWIMECLREKEFFWTCGDAEDLAHMARSWGLIWRGAVPFDSLNAYHHGGNRDGGRSPQAFSLGSPNVPEENPGSQWDVGDNRDGAPSGGRSGGGGWDTGGK